MAWAILVAAGLLEVAWSFAMKASEGFSRLVPSVIFVATAIASVGLLAIAMRSLPLGTAYAIWTGIGSVGAFVAGIVFLGESASPLRLLAAAMIVGGLVLMKVVTETA